MVPYIDELLELCKKQPFNIEDIQEFIEGNDVSSEEVTRVALQLCDYGMFSYSDYIFHNNKEPQPRDLRTYNWEALFDLLIDNGLDASLVICDDGINYENILQSLKFFDDGDLGAKILRNVLAKGFSPNVVIDGTPFCAEVDNDFIFDILTGMYTYKWQLDNAFRFWLVLIGFGGATNENKLPVEMCGGFSPEIFKEYEKYDYKIIYGKNDFELRIVDKETNTVVATA